MTTFNDAKLYLDAGISIFPVKQVPNDIDASKEPDVPSWNQFQKKKPTIQMLQYWFGNGTKRNIAMVTGKVSSNCIAIDFDKPDVYEQWYETYKELADKTAIAKSGKGYHVLFRLTKAKPETYQKALFNGEYIEVKGEGACINVWPSVHGSGHQYEWIRPPWDGIVEIENLECIGIKKPSTMRALDDTPIVSPEEAYVKAALESEMQILASSREGERNNQLFKSTASLFGLVASGYLNHAETESTLRQTARQIGLEEREVNRTIQSGIKAGLANRRTIPKNELKTQQQSEWLHHKKIIKYFHREELGDAELLATLFKDQIVYDHAEKSWYVWTGHFWEQDKKKQVTTLLDNVAAQFMNCASVLRKNSNKDDDETIKELWARAKRLRYKNRINNVLSLATSHENLALSGDEWEQGTEMLLACQNGVIDLTTGEFRESNPKDYVRTFAPVEWTGLDTHAPLWEKFLNDIFNNDTELIAFIQRLFGYSLTGKANEAILPILYGEGRNGKSTLLETLKYVLGSLASPASQDVIIESYRNQSGNASPHLYALRHLRLAWVSETKEGQKLNEGQVKHLTGMDTITCRPLFREEVTFKTTHLLCLITNNKPKANADDFALWNRILLIPFTQAFVKNPSDDNEHEADANLFEKLKSESNGILAWLVRGCLEYQEIGLNPPNSVTKATEDYKAEEDELSLFIEECCITEGVESEKTKVKYLYAAYTEWTTGEGIKPLNNRSFGKRLSKRFESSRSTGTQYHGIVLKLKPAEQQKMIQFTKKKDVF